MSDNKYYTPSIENVCIGITYQSLQDERLPDKESSWETTTIETSSDLEMFMRYYRNDAIEFRVKYLDREDIESEGWKYDDKYSAFTESSETMIFSKTVKYRGEDLIIMLLYNPVSNWLLLSSSKGPGVYEAEKRYEKPSIPLITIKTDGVMFAGNCKNKSQLKQILQWTQILK